MLRTLVGSRAPSGELRVWLDGQRLEPGPSLELRSHSVAGFGAGYQGSGSAQLALAVLLACGWSPDAAVTFYQDFKVELISKLAGREFVLTFDPEGWLKKKMAQDADPEPKT